MIPPNKGVNRTYEALGINAPDGATSITKKLRPSNGHIHGHQCPKLNVLLLRKRSIDL